VLPQVVLDGGGRNSRPLRQLPDAHTRESMTESATALPLSHARNPRPEYPRIWKGDGR
jgi:hypothetical protein